MIGLSRFVERACVLPDSCIQIAQNALPIARQMTEMVTQLDKQLLERSNLGGSLGKSLSDCLDSARRVFRDLECSTLDE